MSDFLRNLAARSLEAVATIQPRLASFYEAPQKGFALPEPAETTEERTGNDAIAVTEQSRDEGAAAPAKPVAVISDLPGADAAHAVAQSVDYVVADDVRPRSAPITAAVVSDETTAAPAPAPPALRQGADRFATSAFTSSPAPPIANDTVSELPRERRESREVSSPIAALERAVDSVRPVESARSAGIAARIAARITTRMEQSEDAQPHAERQPPALTSEQRRPSAQPELTSRSPRLKDEPTPRVSNDFAPPEPPRRDRIGVATKEFPTPHRITPSRIVSESQPMPRVQPVPRHPRQHSQATSAPDVHITIGRVEVRAVAAAEPPARGRSAAPSGLMNLDDYLRRRDGRGRR